MKLEKTNLKLIELVNLIKNINDHVVRFETYKTEKIIQVEKLCTELNINIDKIREDDVLGFVDAVDYGRGFDRNLFIRYINKYLEEEQ